MKAGKCFTCKKQGHLSCDCPQRPPQRPCTNARASTSAQIEDNNSDNEEPAKVRSRKKKHSASEIIEILKEADEEAKDSVIQEFFMKEDFQDALTLRPGLELLAANLCILLGTVL